MMLGPESFDNYMSSVCRLQACRLRFAANRTAIRCEPRGRPVRLRLIKNGGGPQEVMKTAEK